MKIVEETSDRLVFKDSSICLSIFIFLITCLLNFFGFRLILIPVLNATLQCQRAVLPQGNCILTQSYLIGKKEVFWAPTSHLERAKLGVITVETDDGIKNAHRPVIQFLNRDVPMSPFFVSGGFDSDRNRAGFVVDRVNTFVNNPSETYLSVRFDRDRSLDSYGVGGFMIFMGFLFMYTAISSHVKYFLIVDRSQRKVICKKEYLVLPPEIEEWHFRDIADVELVVKTDNDDIESYSSEICLHSSECVPILLGFSNKEKLQESLSKIRQMLK